MRKTIKTIKVEGINSGKIVTLKLTRRIDYFGNHRGQWMRHGKPVQVFFNRGGRVNVVAYNRKLRLTHYVTV